MTCNRSLSWSNDLKFFINKNWFSYFDCAFFLKVFPATRQTFWHHFFLSIDKKAKKRKHEDDWLWPVLRCTVCVCGFLWGSIVWLLVPISNCQRSMSLSVFCFFLLLLFICTFDQFEATFFVYNISIKLNYNHLLRQSSLFSVNFTFISSHISF